MDAGLSAIAAEAGRVLVRAMASDGWEALRPLIARAFNLGNTEHLLVPLDADRHTLFAGELSEAAAAGRWEGRLDTLLHHRPELRAMLAALTSELRDSMVAGQVSVHSAVTGDRIQAATAGRDMVHSNNHTTTNRRTNFGGVGIIVAVVAVLLLTGGLVAHHVTIPVFNWFGSGKLDAETACADFLQAPQWQREQAVRRIAVELEVESAGNPFMPLNVEHQCGQQLDAMLGEVIAHQRY